MKIPHLRKLRSVKTYHGHKLTDDYAWVDQPDILEVLQKPEKLLPEVKKYIKENDKLNIEFFKDTKNLQKKIFFEIKNKIKLEDESLKYKDKNYFYWNKVTKKGQNPRSSKHLVLNKNVSDFDPVSHKKYLAHEDINNLKGMEIQMVYKWNIGEVLIFDRTNLHASSCNIIKNKLTVTSIGIIC